MLFNSIEFIFLFLPIVLVFFYWSIHRRKYQGAIFILLAASLFSYAWWKPVYLFILTFSILFNYLISRRLLVQGRSYRQKRILLTVGVVGNLMLLGYYKYAVFIIDNLNIFTLSHIDMEVIILPLAISFFTFQQIAFLVDTYRGECKEYKFLHYVLFVTFFPQLIAGPIVHHKEMMPQFYNFDKIKKFALNNFVIGLTIFILGLFKKVILADNLALYATPVFNSAANDVILTFFEAWFGVLAYTLQLYFDFSGYSDMAIGLARMFGILIPLNFHSPYKSVNIIDFWRRWHMTLSRFLKDYLYIPLGGNRKGKFRRYINLMITMLLAGLWHGASWNFVIWGGMHGVYLVVNQGWHRIRGMLGFPVNKDGSSHAVLRLISIVFTFILVMITWVPFRADDIHVSLSIYKSMFGMNGVSLPIFLKDMDVVPLWLVHAVGIQFDGMFHHGLADFISGIFYLPLFLMIVFLMPNSQEYMGKFSSQLNQYACSNDKPNVFVWRPTFINGFIFGILIFSVVTAWISVSASEFLYFNF